MKSISLLNINTCYYLFCMSSNSVVWYS